MVNIELLKQVINESGITMTALAKKANITRETIYNRLNGIGEFTASEIVGMTKALNLSGARRDEIFFANKVE